MGSDSFMLTPLLLHYIGVRQLGGITALYAIRIRPASAVKKSGHKMMSPECPNYTDIDNIVFRSSDHVFSNFYNCNIKVNNEEFLSTECAYQWLKCIILNRPDVAERVKSATTSNQAKQIVKDSDIDLKN